jgi:putative endonuclease
MSTARGAAGSLTRSTARQLSGRAAEEAAAQFLREQGCEILLRNFRRRLGELDIVARRGEMLIVAEVRMRASDAYGGAAASVDALKQRRIVRATLQLLQQQPALARLRIRFDVIVVRDLERTPPSIEWLAHAFQA